MRKLNINILQTFILLFTISVFFSSCSEDIDTINQEKVTVDLTTVNKLISGFDKAFHSKVANSSLTDKNLNSIFLNELEKNGLSYSFSEVSFEKSSTTYSDEFENFKTQLVAIDGFTSKSEYISFLNDLRPLHNQLIFFFPSYEVDFLNF